MAPKLRAWPKKEFTEISNYDRNNSNRKIWIVCFLLYYFTMVQNNKQIDGMEKQVVKIFCW